VCSGLQHQYGSSNKIERKLTDSLLGGLLDGLGGLLSGLDTSS
jgi:hypothetical protein